jgi:transposase-like protein
MGLIPVRCPSCQRDHVIKGGKTRTEKQRYRGQNADCSHASFVLRTKVTSPT